MERDCVADAVPDPYTLRYHPHTSPIAFGLMPMACAMVLVTHLDRVVVLVSDIVDEIERDDEAVLDRVMVGIGDALSEAASEGDGCELADAKTDDVGRACCVESPDALACSVAPPVGLAFNEALLAGVIDASIELVPTSDTVDVRAGETDTRVDAVLLGETEFEDERKLVAVVVAVADDVFVAVSVGILVTRVARVSTGAAP